MKGYVCRRLIRVVPIVLLVSAATFALLHLAPGGPAAVMAGGRAASEADLERIERAFGLDRPLPVQYLVWLRRVFFGLDFGTSYATGEPVSRMILARAGATIELMGTAFAIALVVAIAAGAAAAARRDRVVDEIVSVLSAAGVSMPVFWLGIVAIYVFSLRLGLFPSGGRESIGAAGAADRLRHLALPALVLASGFAASWSRYVRAQLLEIMSGEFVRTARAKGLGEGTVLFKHAMRPALLPVLAVTVLHLPALFTGAVITETVFSWPGMGRLFYDGLARHDYPRVLGIVVVSSFLVILANLLGDILGAAVDPRIALGRDGGGPPSRASGSGRSAS